jgi:hypothetical protein
MRVRCLSAAQDLLLQSPVLQQTQQQLPGLLEGSLLQRLHSILFSSLTGSCNVPAAAAAAAVQCSSTSSYSTVPILQQQSHQQQPEQQHPSCWQQSRSYARVARPSQRNDRNRQDRYQQQQQQQQQRADVPQLRLGRHLGNCIPTVAMRQPDESEEAAEARLDPFKERDPLLINPRQVRQYS